MEGQAQEDQGEATANHEYEDDQEAKSKERIYESVESTMLIS